MLFEQGQVLPFACEKRGQAPFSDALYSISHHLLSYKSGALPSYFLLVFLLN